MTVLSKSKVKLVDRATLYYNKYGYRVVMKSPHMFYSHWCANIAEYRDKINTICQEYDANQHAISFLSWRRPKPSVQDWEYDLIENIYNLSTKYTIKKEFTLRRETSAAVIYTNNIAMINDILVFCPEADVSHVVPMPTGILTFKRDPPAKYRVYLSNVKAPVDFKEELLSYLKRTPDLRPSGAFSKFLRSSSHRFRLSYLWDRYYIDYDDEKNLMMLMLMFPGMIGKKYKLEKK